MVIHEIHAYKGNVLHSKGWQQEAAMRLLMNNLDPDVAKDPDNLIVYGGRGKAARNWEAYNKIIKELSILENDETLLIQSGKPVGVFKTSPDVPRVLIVNAQIVPKWATDDIFWELERKGLTMFGQMTAGSWIYIGSQGVLQGTFETLATLAHIEFGQDTLKGKWVLSSGLGEMGGAQPLAITMNEGVAIVVEVDKSKIDRRLKQGYLDTWTDKLEDALKMKEEALKEGKPVSIGLLGNAADVYVELKNKGIVPDVVTDQTAAHDITYGYIPNHYTFEEALELRNTNLEKYKKEVYRAIVEEVKAMLWFKDNGSKVFDYGNSLRTRAKENGLNNAFDIQGYVPAYLRHLFAIGSGPFRWVALSGDKEDIYKIDEAVIKNFSDNKRLVKWIKLAKEKVHFQGLPARICYMKYGEREKFGKMVNDMVKNKELSAPIAIGRDHHDTGSVASPYRETESMKDGSDAIADWPLLNALLNAISGASWVSIHHGGGVGIGNSIHAGVVIIADGTDASAKKIERVLNADPGIGVIRHADAGYESSTEIIKKGVKFRYPYL